jgi:hypothetical protein
MVKKDKAEFLTLDNIIPSPHRRGWGEVKKNKTPPESSPKGEEIIIKYNF